MARNSSLVLLTSAESLEFAASPGSRTDPLAWLQWRPRLGHRARPRGIYAAFVVGGPLRAPSREECHVVATPGELTDAVLGRRADV